MRIISKLTIHRIAYGLSIIFLMIHNKRELFSSADQALYSVKDAGGKDCAFAGEWI